MARKASADARATLRRALRDLSAIGVEGERGYRAAALSAHDPSLRALFERRAGERAAFVAALVHRLAREDGSPPERGTPLGLPHRRWLDPRGSIFGVDDRTLVEACLRGETAAIREYENAPKPVRDLVGPQLLAVRAARAELARALTQLEAVPAEEARARALRYAADHYTMTLATISPAGPWASTVMYVNEGLVFYFLSAPEARHARNLASDRRVSATINEDYSSWAAIKGIQLEGTVELVLGHSERAHLFESFLRRFPFLRDMLHEEPEGLSMLPSPAMYRVRATRIFFLDHAQLPSRRVELRGDLTQCPVQAS